MTRVVLFRLLFTCLCLFFLISACRPVPVIREVEPGIRQVELKGANDETITFYQMYDADLKDWFDAEQTSDGWAFSDEANDQREAMPNCQKVCKGRFPGTGTSCIQKYNNCVNQCLGREPL